MRLASRLTLILLLVCASFAASPALAQISLTTLGTPYAQNFDTLATSGTANTWADNTTIPGWYAQFSLQPANPITYRAEAGAGNAGALYSYGTGTATERALGSVGSGTPGDIFYAVRLVNNTGSTLTSLVVSFTGEQWRAGGCTPTPCTPAIQKLDLQYQVANAGVITDSNTPTTNWLDHDALDFNSPTPGTSTAAALDGNAAANRTALSSTILLTVNPGQEVWLRWRDINDANNDHGLSIDDLSVTPQGGGVALNISDVTLAEGDPPGTTTFTFAVTLTAPAGPGGVTFDIATADGTAQDDNPATEDNDYVAQSLTGQSIPLGSTGPYNFSVTVNRDLVSETNETFFVNVTNVVGATAGDVQGLGTITNDDVTVVFIHDVQGNGAATPIPGATVTVEGVVIGNFQGSNKLSGFFLQEEDADADADPATSEGIFIFCSACPTAVAEGQRVRATGSVSEFNGMTEITASTAGSVVVTNAGNNLAQVTPSPIDLPIVGVVNDFYEAREGMRVIFVDTLTVSEYFELARFGHIELFEGGRPRQFTEANPPSVAGLTAHNDNLDRRRVVLDDDNNNQNASLAPFQPDGMQFIFHPRANGGFSVGTQGTDFFRGGDLVNGLTGVLHWSFPGVTPDTWRIRPTAATPATFTVANPRPATPPNVGGAIKVVGMNLLNYFTTIDTTSSNNTGPCAPSMTLDCRGADSNAELIRQRERASIVICTLNADVFGFAELENTTPSASITDLLGAVNTRCGGAHPYTFANTGGTLGTDAIRVQQIYRTGIVSPVGSPLSDLDPVHNRPPTAQTYDVVDAANPAFGQRFTVIVNHFKSKGCPGTGGDADAGDGQSCFNATRVAQANRLMAWINSTVLPAAGDPDVLLLGDFNANAKEDPITALAGGGYNDLETTFQGANAYSYLFDGQLGHLDYGFANAALLPQVTGADAWHINADEAPLFDYNDEVADTGEAAFEEKPDGSALVPPRVLFQPMSPYRASDHDPVVVGLFATADLAITKTDSPDPVTAGSTLTYTITVTNNGPDAAASASWSDTLPVGTTFASLPAVAGWSCTTGATVSCSNPSFAVGSAVFTLTVNVSPAVAAGSVLSNTATVTAATGDSNTANNSATATTTVAALADLAVTKTDSPDPVTAGTNLTYTITVTNAGPSNAASVSWSDTLPAGTTFVSLPAVAGWSCTTGATVSCSNPSFGVGSAVFTLTVAVAPGTSAGTVISNTAAATSATPDPTPGNDSATATTTVGTGTADLSVTKDDAFDPTAGGINFNYTITVSNAGPSNATTASLSDTLPAGTTFVALSSPAGWSCTTPAVGSGGTVTCTNASFAAGSAVFTLTVAIAPATIGTISNTATVSAATTDPNPANNSDTETTLVTAAADMSVTKVDTPDPVAAGANLTYTITVSNGGPSNAPTASLSDTLPAGTTFVSLSSPAGWSCTTPAVGAGGTVTCTHTSMPPGSAVFTLVVQVGASVANGTVLSNTATVATTGNDLPPDNNTATATTTVTNTTGSQASVSGTKSASGTFTTGGTVTYTVVLSNAGPGTQGDNPGDEFIDVLPAGLTLVSATATSGTAVATVGTNTVTWNGSIPAAGSVTITITATITATSGTISNQGSISFDADGNGTNEATAMTDDPATAGAGNPTTFVVVEGGPAPGPTNIPTLDEVGLALLVLLLAMGGALTLRKRRV